MDLSVYDDGLFIQKEWSLLSISYIAYSGSKGIQLMTCIDNNHKEKGQEKTQEIELLLGVHRWGHSDQNKQAETETKKT